METAGNLGLVVALSRNELARDLEPSEIEALATITQLETVEAGSRLFRLGESADALLMVARGTVALTLPVIVHGDSREVTLDEKGAGSLIAWSALVPPHKLTLSGKAMTNVALLRLDQAKLKDLFVARPELHLKIVRSLNRVIAGRLAVMEGLLVRRLQQWIDDNERR